MPPLAVIELAISLGQAALQALGTKPEYAGVLQSVQAGTQKLDEARNQILTLKECESLRVQPQW
jgi:hypothetical protein